jgi:outer membrane protein TolC
MWSLEFNSPLFLRKERGEVKLANIKLQEAQLDIQNKQERLLFKARAALNSWSTTTQQIELYQRTVEDYRRLLEGERTLFRGGESSLFMVNSRERNYINAQIKLNKLLTQNQKAGLNARYAFGILNS